MDARERLEDLIRLYQKYKRDNKSTELSEEETRGWINKLLEIFDWDVLNTQQVQQEKVLEEGQKNKLADIESTHTKPDYSLVNGDSIKAYLDAKKTSVDIFKSKEAAFQVRSYGWSAGLPCSFLTNFEQFVIFDCCHVPTKGEEANIGAIQISIDNYVDEFEVLNNHLNRILVYKNNLKNLYDVEKIDGSQTVDELFNRLLSDFRIVLANNMYTHNMTSLSIDELNYYVQIILDRIIFIRVCESKGIEKEGLLKDFVQDGFWDKFKKSCYAEFYEHYDGAMFSKGGNDKFLSLVLDDDIFEQFIYKLYYPYPYRFDVVPTKVIAKVYEDFLAYALCMDNGLVVACLKEEYVKTNGAIPTHEFISDAICKETISLEGIDTPEKLFSLKILDPCCGSGVFLISAYEYLAKALMGIINQTNEWCIVDGENKYLTIKAKRKIMRECLYGIDCDSTATEVTKMSLALKIIDDTENEFLSEIGLFGKKILQDIHHNVVPGNTLVDIDIDCLVSELKDIRPLSIRNQVYKSVFDEKGGFDYVIGNPPYVETKYFKAASKKIHNYLREKYVTFEGKVDLSVLFVERTLSLLNDNGVLGMIIQRRWFKTKYGKGARAFITSGSHLYKLLDIETNSLFKGKTTYVSVLILTKNQSDKVYYDVIEGNPSDVQTYFESEHELSTIDKKYFTTEIWAPELRSIFEIKQKYADRYGTIGSCAALNICVGTQALWKKMYDILDYSEEDGVITGRNGFCEVVSIEKEMVKPVIYNKTFKALKKLSVDAYRIFPYEGNDNRTRMTISSIKEKYPLAYAYLSNNEQRIKAKVKFNTGEYWPTYTRENNHDSFESAKILVPMTTKETYATFENSQGFYMDNSNVWFINHKDNDVIVMKALTMIINSTVFSVLTKCGANQAREGYYKFNKQFIEPVPIPNNKLNANDATVIRLSEMYDIILDIMVEYENASSVDAMIYKGVLEEKWNEVDNMCFDFYEMNENEVAIISSLGRVESRIPGGDVD